VRRQANAVPVLMYHHISTSPGMITVSPDHFAAQMAYLAQAGYRTVVAEQLGTYLAGASLPAKSLGHCLMARFLWVLALNQRLFPN
jgi:hypothetical protein